MGNNDGKLLGGIVAGMKQGSVSMEYNVSGITTYTSGLAVGGVLYATTGDAVSLTLGSSRIGYTVEGYEASAGTLSGTANPYTLTMPSANVTINATSMTLAPLAGEGALESPYTISNADDWIRFCANVLYVTQYSGQYVKLLEDISVSEMVGTSQSKSFQGTFLGNDKTLTFTKGTAETAFGEEYCAPFRHVSDATIRDLKVAGDIYTSQKFAAGLVARSYGATTVTNCQVGTVIHSTISGDGTHGGFVSMPGYTLNIEGCAYTGRMLTNNVTNSSGGFVGWHNAATVSVSNSLYAPSDDITAGWSAISDGATFVRGGSPTVTNCYYTELMGTAQGTQAYAYDAAPANLGDAVADGNYGYITAYANGILYDGKYYVAPAAVTLADNADNSTVLSGFAGQAANVTLADRTLYRDGDWNTLCLPFAISRFAGTIFEDATVMTLSTDGTGFDATTGTLTLNFETATAIEAGKPYIVKWTRADGYDDAPANFDIASPVFSGVQIKNVDPATAAFTSADGDVTFRGTFSPVAFTPDDKSNLFLGTANTLYYPNAANNEDGSYYVNACRAYFHVNLSGQANSVRAFVLHFGDEETAGVTTPLSNRRGAGGEAWYTLDGRKLDGKPSRAGVYIYKWCKESD